MLRKVRALVVPLFALAFVLLALPASACLGSDGSIKELGIEQVAALLASHDPIHVFDANSKEQYDRAHVPGAKWVPFNRVSAELLPADKSATLIFYCYNPMCSASTMAARRASELGYTRVHVMPAGIEGWTQAGKSVEGQRPRAPHA